MSEQSERELLLAIRELRETVGGLQEATERNTAAIDALTGRVDKLDERMEKQERATTALTTTMERVNVRLTGKLDAGEITGFAEATNSRLSRLERAVFPNGE